MIVQSGAALRAQASQTRGAHTGELSKVESESGLFSDIQVLLRSDTGLPCALIAPKIEADPADAVCGAPWEWHCMGRGRRRPRPTIVAISGEEQLHVSKLFRAWQADQRDWQVVVPMRRSSGTPYLFEPEGVKEVVDLLKFILRDSPVEVVRFPIEGGKFHVAGTSNGGAAALAIARAAPSLIASLTLVTGFLPPGITNLSPLRELKSIRLYVGDADEMGHLTKMQGLKRALEKSGVGADFKVVPNAGHFNIGAFLDVEELWSGFEDARESVIEESSCVVS
eukprot:TRINITY_DN51548_c0_g1_i1.p1 TRINITY_DN51548_c0_g1~~TRINITY_DN51548_c0_g1_i1.p1  ORF type:complete len:281 (+),score=36.29 TRINITY_DN51548_c0_g1_i1:42-884(+)